MVMMSSLMLCQQHVALVHTDDVGVSLIDTTKSFGVLLAAIKGWPNSSPRTRRRRYDHLMIRSSSIKRPSHKCLLKVAIAPAPSPTERFPFRRFLISLLPVVKNTVPQPWWNFRMNVRTSKAPRQPKYTFLIDTFPRRFNE